MTTSKKELTAMQKLFVHEYLIDLKAEGAAIRSGYSEKTAYSIGSELIRKPHVAAAIQEQMDKRAAKIEVRADTVLAEILKLATSDLRKLFDSKGALLPPESWPDDVAMAVAGVDVDEIWEGYGEERTMTGYTKKVKLWDKPKALEMLGRHLKMFVDKLEITDNTDRADKLAKARKRVGKNV